MKHHKLNNEQNTSIQQWPFPLSFCLFIAGMSLIFQLSFSACMQRTAQAFYGEPFDTLRSISVSELVSQMQNQKQVQAVVTGKISSSCQDDGCWLNLENPGGKEIYVEWDEKFHLPLDISGKKVLVNGYAYIDSSTEGNPIAFKASGVKL